MSSALKNLSVYDETTLPDASESKIAIVVSEWHPHITHALYEGCYDTLIKHGVLPDNIFTMQVPGSFELPIGARMISSKHSPDAVVCLGCVIKGDTDHNEYINQAVAQGIASLGVAMGRPFIFGLLTTHDEQQALDRAGGKHGNKGVECAVAAIRMAAYKREAKEGKKPIGF